MGHVLCDSSLCCFPQANRGNRSRHTRVPSTIAHVIPYFFFPFRRGHPRAPRTVDNPPIEYAALLPTATSQHTIRRHSNYIAKKRTKPNIKKKIANSATRRKTHTRTYRARTTLIHVCAYCARHTWGFFFSFFSFF